MRNSLILLMSLILFACTEEPKTVDKTAPQSAAERQAEITKMESELVSKQDLNVETNRVLAERIVTRYRDYITMNPTDSASAEYLFKAADISVGLGNYEASINYINRLTKDFPKYEKVVEIWLFKGFIYENYMDSHAQAVKAYEELILKYPNHRLAQDAQAAIDNLTLSEEELLEKFKKMNEQPES
ncbi:MAG: tetratricopeptide repeat protein [Flavobacteriales bacterium]|jgi:tetratricopeptide (TPR) repeat protein|nr:tetratricopeptide repeat protein [Flavobacteriales bacterium]